MRINIVQNNASSSYYKPIPLKNSSMNSMYFKRENVSSKVSFGDAKAEIVAKAGLIEAKAPEALINTLNGMFPVKAQFSTEIPFKKGPLNAELQLHREVKFITETTGNMLQVADKLLGATEKTAADIRIASDNTVGILEEMLERLNHAEQVFNNEMRGVKGTLKRVKTSQGEKVVAINGTLNTKGSSSENVLPEGPEREALMQEWIARKEDLLRHKPERK